jgi:hypothetical protein
MHRNDKSPIFDLIKKPFTTGFITCRSFYFPTDPKTDNLNHIPMRKVYALFVLALISSLPVRSQVQVPSDRQSLERQTISVPAPLKETLFAPLEPKSADAPGFEFDSLNVSYLGSWGFGQSFTISCNEAGSIVFVGSGAGVTILDVTIPSSPVKLSEISARGLVDAAYFDEATNRLYLCAYFAGFEIWDVSDMAAPVKLGGGPTEGLPRGGIFASGNYVYVVTVADGVQVFDVTNPSSPVNTGNCPLSASNLAWNSAKSGDLIFVAIGNGGMKVVDVSDPANPFVAGSFSYLSTGVSVANGYAYVVSYNMGLRVLDISNLAGITQIGYVQIPGYPVKVRVVGNYAYIANSTTSTGGGINVVDVSVPASPQLITTYNGYADYIAVNGSVLSYTGMIFPCNILDISDPVSPAFASSYDLPISTMDLSVKDNYAYTGNNGFRVFDITDKSHPVQVGYDSTDGAIVRPAGDLAVYIRESMTANNPVMVMDISDPANPGFLGQYMAPVMTNDLEVKDHYAFVACWWDGFRVVDFQDPSNPLLVAHKMGWFTNAIPGVDYCYVQALDIEGDYIYLIDYLPFPAEDTRGLYIFDISDPVNPIFISRYNGLVSGGYDIDVVGNYAYIADMNGGAEVIDVTSKLAPVALGYVPLPDVGNAIKVKEDHVFVAAYINGGVQVVNVADPNNPYIDGYYARSGCFALGVNVEGNDIYLADGAGGFQIYETSLLTGLHGQKETEGVSSVAYPDPFTDHVTIQVDIENSKGLAMKVCDTYGRVVATLFPQTGSSGRAIWDWNGKTANGADAAPGIYYYTIPSVPVSGKMVKVR